MKTIVRAVTLVMSMGILNSCREEATAPMLQLPAIVDWGHQGPRALERFTLPLQGNNQWVYIDSSYNTASVRVETVSHVVTEDGIFRYEVSNIEPFGLYVSFLFMYIRNDTVFCVNPNSWRPGSAGILYLPGRSSQDTATFLFPGPVPMRVYPLGNPLATPAGVFDSVFVYDARATTGLIQYFRPGVGVLETKVVDPGDTSKVYIHSRLAYYLLNSF